MCTYVYLYITCCTFCVLLCTVSMYGLICICVNMSMIVLCVLTWVLRTVCTHMGTAYCVYSNGYCLLYGRADVSTRCWNKGLSVNCLVVVLTQDEATANEPMNIYAKYTCTYLPVHLHSFMCVLPTLHM